MTAVLRVVRGNPTAEELGAVVALLAARSGGDIGKPDVTTPSLWGTPQLRGTLSHGTGAWKASGLPR